MNFPLKVKFSAFGGTILVKKKLNKSTELKCHMCIFENGHKISKYIHIYRGE